MEGEKTRLVTQHDKRWGVAYKALLTLWEIKGIKEMGAQPSQTQTPAFWGRVGMFHLSWIWGHREGRRRHHSGKLRWRWRAWMLLPSLVLQNFFKVIIMMCVYACCVSEYMSRGTFVQSRRQLCEVRSRLSPLHGFREWTETIRHTKHVPWPAEPSAALKPKFLIQALRVWEDTWLRHWEFS